MHAGFIFPKPAIMASTAASVVRAASLTDSDNTRRSLLLGYLGYQGRPIDVAAAQNSEAARRDALLIEALTVLLRPAASPKVAAAAPPSAAALAAGALLVTAAPQPPAVPFNNEAEPSYDEDGFLQVETMFEPADGGGGGGGGGGGSGAGGGSSAGSNGGDDLGLISVMDLPTVPMSALPPSSRDQDELWRVLVRSRSERAAAEGTASVARAGGSAPASLLLNDLLPPPTPGRGLPRLFGACEVFGAVLELDLSGNGLTSLPREFGAHLGALRVLHLGGALEGKEETLNKLTALPPTFRLMARLEDVSLHDNDLG